MGQFEADRVGQFQPDEMGQPKSESIDQCDRILHFMCINTILKE